jgi:hypothetical protein
VFKKKKPHTVCYANKQETKEVVVKETRIDLLLSFSLHGQDESGCAIPSLVEEEG